MSEGQTAFSAASLFSPQSSPLPRLPPSPPIPSSCRCLVQPPLAWLWFFVFSLSHQSYQPRAVTPGENQFPPFCFFLHLCLIDSCCFSLLFQATLTRVKARWWATCCICWATSTSAPCTSTSRSQRRRERPPSPTPGCWMKPARRGTGKLTKHNDEAQPCCFVCAVRDAPSDRSLLCCAMVDGKRVSPPLAQSDANDKPRITLPSDWLEHEIRGENRTSLRVLDRVLHSKLSHTVCGLPVEMLVLIWSLCTWKKLKLIQSTKYAVVHFV